MFSTSSCAGNDVLGKSCQSRVVCPEASVLTIKQCDLPSGFDSLPKGVSISPGDGYGTLLPLETLPLTFSFMPPLTGPYTFQLECRTPLTTHFPLPCTALAVLPAVMLSHNCIKVQYPSTLHLQ